MEQRIEVQLGVEPVGNQPLTAVYRQMGDRGPVILMLHGFLGSSACWLPLMEQLSPYYRCIGLDLLGFGHSAKPRIRYDVATEVAFVRQFVQALNLEPCYLLGHSFGGWVSSAYAIQYPQAVQGLILAAAAGIRDDSFCGRYTHLRPLLWMNPIVDWALTLADPIAHLLGQGAALHQLQWFRRELKGNPAARSFLLDRIRPEDAIDTVEHDLHRLPHPALVIIGDQDDTIPRWHAEEFAQGIPNARLTLLPGATHALPQQHAAELTSLILAFLAETAAVGEGFSRSQPVR